jgi:ParB-like chromosome segregation protein Spo0J
MKIVIRKIKDLIPAEYNPRTLSKKQFKDISASFEQFGIVAPILVNKHPKRQNIIIGGHQRVKVAEHLGIKEVPTIELSLPLKKERELNVRLNKNTGSFDMDALANLFDEEDLLDWGFTEVEFFSIEEPVDISILEDEDFDEELDAMEGNARRAIMIPFENKDYEDARELYKSAVAQGSYVGKLLIDMLVLHLSENNE